MQTPQGNDQFYIKCKTLSTSSIRETFLLHWDITEFESMYKISFNFDVNFISEWSQFDAYEVKMVTLSDLDWRSNCTANTGNF